MMDALRTLDATVLSRIEFGFTISFHILFPALSIGLAGFLVALEALWLKTRDELPPPSMTLFAAAAAPESQWFLLPGLLLLVPVIVSSTWFNYRLFRDKDDGDSSYEHLTVPR